MKFNTGIKKVFALVLVISMVLGLMTTAFADTNTKDSLAELPAVGEKVNGFTVVERNKIDVIDAETAYFKHDKSGANLLYIQTEDNNKSFDITFRTPALDNTGMPHVLEHISICGSQEFPSQNLFFPIINQTYTTFINALTGPTYTSYPVASMSEEQLMVLSDFYMGGVFNTLLSSESRLHSREAWRYELTDKDAPIKITGTVYNEMKGNQNIDNASYYNINRALFPNSLAGNVSGGDPSAIPDMSYEELLNFHDTYYVPSNALIILYGNLDYKSFLKHFDEKFLSKFDNNDVNIETGIIDPLTQEQNKTYMFPVEQGASTVNASVLDYGFALNNVTEEEVVGLELLMESLNLNSSVLYKNMEKAFPGVSVYAGIVTTNRTPFLDFSASGLNESDKAAFKKVVNDSINEIIANGVDREVIDSIFAATEMNSLMVAEDSNLGVDLSLQIARKWTNNNDINGLNTDMKAMEAVAGKLDTSFLQDLAKKYITDNKHTAIIATVPSPGLVEKNNAELESKLAQVKANMTDAEIEALVKETQDFKVWTEAEAPEEMLDKFKVVNADNLPLNIKSYDVSTATKSGVKLMTTEASVGNIGMTNMFFDSSFIKPEDLQYYSLYTNLLGNLDTRNYSKNELSTVLLRYMSGFNTLASMTTDINRNFHPKFRVNWTSLNDNYEKCLELIDEILFNTDFSNTEDISNYVSQAIVSMKQSINMSGFNYMFYRLCGQDNIAVRYSSYLQGFEYYAFLQDVAKQLSTDPQAVADKLSSISEQLKNKNNLAVLYAGNKEGVDNFNSTINKFIDKLTAKSTESADYSVLPAATGREGIVVDSAIQYNMVYSSLEDLGYEYSGKLQPLSKYIYDAYLTPKIRHGIGAYDNIVDFSESGLVLMSYRDPSIVETNKVYDELGNFLKNVNITDKDLESYIISSYGENTRAQGELSGAISYIRKTYNGYTDEDTKQFLEEIKSLKVADLRNFAYTIQKLTDNGIRGTIGGASMIEQNQELFDSIFYPLGESNGESDKPLTRAEVISLLFGGAADAFEQAKALGIIKGSDNGDYGENDNVTREEFAVILSRVLQGLPQGSSDSIKDFDKVSSWAKDAVATMVTLQLMALDQDGNFNSEAPVTMAEFMQILTMLQSAQ